MSKKLYLSKTIQNDPKIQEVFGTKPNPIQQQEPQPKGNSNWKRDMYKAWYRKREPRICENPTCSRSYLPKVPTQRFCSFLCHENFKRHGKPSRNTCVDCGRYSQFLVNKRCSFCREKEARAKHTIIVINNRHKKHEKYHCSKCGKEITESEFEVFHGLCAMCEVAKHYQKVEP